ncbi:hypothetical protein ACQEU5_21950 [Marinactinospora thermotolerans]|uniref:Secreted protein n=1 Tax=Marinactinospora thermotolerans DSM 45154 TaxID=1122192 RepID=A0A1T4P6W4_9ACTN|nr:hypothetical protein [Marinactinospora thermotolerans]SJZ87199.1 hypothetical protein SAMN02745673_01655 [Marinactinospora thermotolerans DSM 45154]
MKRLHLGLAAAFFAGAVVFTAGAPASAASAPSDVSIASTAGPYDTEGDCLIARNEYNRYYDIDSYCFQYPPLFGLWWFHYS